MSSPAPPFSDIDALSTPNPFVDVPSRPMRVKILYTFDNDNKTNCLARLPDVLVIPTVPIDEMTQIGVIELRQCVRAIVASSPELIARLTQGDFTIYAYDYSEYETPLVGQGMLSTLLAATSSTPSAPAHQSKTMITGRVCKNIMGIFSNGVTETLEVKLRLVPVPKPMQSEYDRNMELYRNLSPALSGGFDPNAWSESFNHDDSLVASLEQQSTNFVMPGSAPPSRHQRHMSNASMHSRPPTLSRQVTMEGSRPSSRTSVRSEKIGRSQSDAFGAPVQEAFGEDGPARKRAKITQTNWRGKSAFAGNADSLRVTASTAASIRVHKPVATRPGIGGINGLEPPPRVPTPVPQVQDASQGRPKGLQPSFLRRESSLYQAQTPQSPFDLQSDAIMSSPEENGDIAADGSPLEFPSSPPAMPEPSSPGFPTLPLAADSGYMSGGIMEYVNDDEDRSIDREDKNVTQKYKARNQAGKRPKKTPGTIDDIFVEQTPGPPELLPTRMNMSAAMGGASGNQSNNRDFRAPSVIPPRSSAASPAPSDDLAFGGKPRSGSGAKRKKVIQEKLLKSLASGDMPTYCYNCGAIETPTWRSLYIKTTEGEPSEEDFQELEGETRGVEILTRDPATDKATTYRIIKSVRKNKDKDRQADLESYQSIQVCNPCGLWFNKVKFMRPEDKWTRGPKVVKGKNGKKDELQSDMLDIPSDFPHSDFPQSDFPQSGVWTDQIQPDDTIVPNQQIDDGQVSPQDEEDISPKHTHDLGQHASRPMSRPRATSVQPLNPSHGNHQWNSMDLDAALQRAIQSSPAGLMAGTQESPIELEDDLTPKPTRRLLFPSPRRDGTLKSLDDACLPDHKQTDTEPKPMSPSVDMFINMAFAADKENLPPMTTEDDLAHLFDCSPGSLFKTPSKSRTSSSKHDVKSTPPSKSTAQFEALFATPTPTRRSARIASRTPSRNMDAFLPSFSSAEKKDLLATPSRYMNLTSSPARSTGAEGLVPLTPFTRSLTQLLSEGGSGLDFHSNEFGMSDVASMAALFSPATLGAGFEATRHGGSERGFSSPRKALDFGLTPEKIGRV